MLISFFFFKVSAAFLWSHVFGHALRLDVL